MEGFCSGCRLYRENQMVFRHEPGFVSLCEDCQHEIVCRAVQDAPWADVSRLLASLRKQVGVTQTNDQPAIIPTIYPAEP